MIMLEQVLPMNRHQIRNKTDKAECSISVMYNSRGEIVPINSVLEFRYHFRTYVDARRFLDGNDSLVMTS